MRIVLTGAAGRVAPYVCRHLQDAGHELLCTDIREPDPPMPGFEVADLCQPGEARRLLEGADVLVHFGNHSNDLPRGGFTPQQVYCDNVKMNLLTFDAAVEVGVRQIVFASTVQTISGGPTGDGPAVPYLPADGGYPLNPMWYYGLSKAAAEQMLRVLCRERPQLSAIAIRFPYIPRHDEDLSAYRSGRRKPRSRHAAHASGVGTSEVDQAKEEHRKRWRTKRAYELCTYLYADDVGSLVVAAVQRCPAGLHVLFPAADETHNGEPPAELIERYFHGVPLRKPIEQFTGLVDNTPITELLGWQPSPPIPAAAAEAEDEV